MSFIIPQEWLSTEKSEFRDYLINIGGNIDILKFHPEYRVFKDESEEIGTNSLIIRIKNNNGTNLNLAELNELEDYIVDSS